MRLAEVGQVEWAKRIVNAIRPYDGPLAVGEWTPWWQARFQVATEFVKAERFADALSLIAEISLDEFIGVLHGWSPSIAQIDQKLSREILQQVTRIAGWERPDWEQVYQAISDCRSTSLTDFP